MKFFIQTIDNNIVFDFALELKNAIDRHNFFHVDDKIEYILNDSFVDYIPSVNFKEYCPIGSVEFVCNWFKTFLNVDYKPKNIPHILCVHDFTKRGIHFEKVTYELKERLRGVFTATQFIKDCNTIKSENNGLYHNGFNDIPVGEYQVSTQINEIDAEFRCFVFENKILDIRQYSGDYRLQPDYGLIEKMVDKYKIEAPVSYTLDVGVNKENGTFIIEVHDFFSCGLYGFMETQRLPFMFWRWYFYFINEIDFCNI